nr:O-antigen ligase domain-containing protein [Desulfobacterales bacterium]
MSKERKMVKGKDSDRFLFYGVLSVLVLAPLAFGSVHVWAYSFVELCVSILVTVFLFKRIFCTRKYHQIELVSSPVYPFFLLLSIVIIIQLLPLPPSWIKSISPVTYTDRLKLSPLNILDGSPGSSTTTWFSLSYYRHATIVEALKILSYMGIYFLVLNTVKTRKQLDTIIYVLILVGLFETLYGIGQTFSGKQKIWWWTNIYDRGWVTGTYINRNHFAGYLEMILPLSFGFMVAHIGRKDKKRRWTSKRSRIRSITTYFQDQVFSRMLLVFSISVSMGAGLLLSGSRGGVICFAVALSLTGILFLLKRGFRRHSVFSMMLGLIILFYGVHIGIEKTIKRLEQSEQGLRGRLEITGSVIPMVMDYPVLGVGLGNFTHAYTRYSLKQFSSLNHAHNDWVEAASELGLCGLAIILSGFVYYLFILVRGFLKRNDPYAIGISGGVMAGMVSIALHSFFDFNMHIPANPLTLSALLGIGFIVIKMERHSTYDRFFYRTRRIRLNTPARIGLGCLLALAVFFSISGIVRHFMGEAYCNTVPNSTLNRDKSPPVEEIRKAISWDGGNAEYWYKLARESMRIRDAGYRTEEREKVQEAAREGMWDRKECQMEIIRALEEAVRLNPLKAEYHQRLGWEYTYLWQEPDYHRRWLPAADLCMERAAYFAGGKDPRIHLDLGNYWIMRSKTIDPASPEREAAWAKACWHYKEAQRLDKRKRLKHEIVKYVWMFYPDMELVGQVLVK